MPGVEVAAKPRTAKKPHQIAALTRTSCFDIRMPGLDGMAMARRASLPPIVFVTAYAEFAVEASRWRRSTTC
jgi:DNA-binding LytR/AlgR family response regulator